jgi:uroporphyrin-III C-methyltransferase
MLTSEKGKVIIAGAGPGDPDLITVKLQRYLSQADVIIADRLANPAIIEQYANPLATLIMAGKEGYNSSSVPQSSINELLVQHAQPGKTVLRLKGGDVAFFSNVLDELETLTAHGIAFELVPGITAASGASAYTGIPLTARGHAQGVQFITYNPNSHHSPDKWKHWATANDTLVFYMSTQKIQEVAELLLRYSKRPQMPLAVIEQATTPYQQVHLSTLQQCATDFAGIQFGSPSLIIVGEVVHLYRRFQWQPNRATGSVFNELSTF